MTVIKETHEFDELMMLHDEYCHTQRELEKAQAVVRSSNVSERIASYSLGFLFSQQRTQRDPIPSSATTQ